MFGDFGVFGVFMLLHEFCFLVYMIELGFMFLYVFLCVFV